MASKQEQKLPLTLLIDTKKNQVVVAEANGDFIDTLFSFLTLPLGTITRLVSKNQPQQRTLSCIKNLYKSVENFSDEVFFNSICKKMLLYPRNSCESLCKMLKLNVDDSEPTKYYICSTCEEKGLLSTFDGGSCSCGKLLDKKVKLNEDVGDRDCVFVKKETMYLIFDDLKVLQSSPGNTLQQLQQFGYKNINMLTPMSTTVGLKEILDLLNKSLTSKTPLSDVFLAKNGELYLYQMFTFSSKLSNGFSGILKDIKVTQLDGKFSFGCIDNLNQSVEELNSSCFTIPLSNNPLPNPKVASQFGSRKHPLKYLRDEYYSTTTPSGYRYCNNGLVKGIFIHRVSTMEFFHPKSPVNNSYIGRPSQFVVWDNLEVTPLENTASSFAFLQKLNTPLDDLEDHVVSIAEREALYLLGASLTSSKSALTEALFHLLENPKEEVKAKKFKRSF